MSTPSLLCVPYRLKAGTLYSQIPDSGLGDFTVTRTTTPTAGQATRVNAAGLIELVADNVPRLDYPLGGITAGCPALLVEPSAQNLALQSADFNTTWQPISSATVNTNTAISPDGTQNADTINLAAVNNSRVRQPITLANSTTYTISCFYKNIALTAGQTFGMRFDNGASSPNNFVATALIDLASGTATYSLTGTSGTGFSGTATGRVDNYGNGWYRVLLTFTVGSAGGVLGSFDIGHVSIGAVRSFYAWGAQLETGSIATSYIPTAASPVTRGAETISKTGLSSLIGQTVGTLYVEWENKDNGLSNLIETYNNSSGVAGNSSILIQKSANNGLNIRVFDSLGNYSDSFTVTMPIGKNKVALAYQLGSAVLYLNGSLVGSNSRTYVFSSSRDAVSFDPRGAYPRASAALYPTRLTNAQLQSLTQ